MKTTRERLTDAFEWYDEHIENLTVMDLSYREIANKYLQSHPQPRQPAEEFVNNKLGDKNYTHSPFQIYRNEIIEWLHEFAQQDIELPTDEQYTAGQVDLAYLTGVFNVIGLDGVLKEIERLKAIGKNPSDIFKDIKMEQLIKNR